MQDDRIAIATRRVNRALWLYCFLVVAVTVAAWAAYRAADFDSEFRPLFDKDNRFFDLTTYYEKINHLHDGAAALAQGAPTFNYPAPAAYVYKFLLVGFGEHAVGAYLIFFGMCIAGFAITAWRACDADRRVRVATAAAIVTTAVAGYPMWFTADRGNLEWVAWALCAAGLCLLLRGRYSGAAVLLGIGSAVKPFPVLFFSLLLRRGKVKETVLGGVVAGALVIWALAALGPNPLQAYRDLQPGLVRYLDTQGLNLGSSEQARFEHSLLDGIKSAMLTVKVGGIHPEKAVDVADDLQQMPIIWPRLRPLGQVYLPMTLVVVGLLVLIFYKTPMLNQLTAAAVAVNILPLVSADYTLLHLYVPFGAFVVFLVREVRSGRVEFSNRAMLAMATIYALLFAPLTFLQIYAGDAKLILLLALLFVAARSPMPSEYFGDKQIELA